MIPRDLLPKEMLYFIAGGFAVCPVLATDIDVWVQAEKGMLDETRQRILDHLTDQAIVFEEEQPSSLSIETADYYDTQAFILKVAKVKYEHSLPIHILVTDAAIEDVLRSFDLSICQVALTRYSIVTTDNWTPVTAPIAVLRNTPTTPARLEKYRQRFKQYQQNLTMETNPF
jgi:hypothetical protein